ASANLVNRALCLLIIVEPLDGFDARAFARRSVNAELVHQTLRAGEAFAESGRRLKIACKNLLNITDARPAVFADHLQTAALATFDQRHADRAALRVLVDVARQLRSDRCQLDLRDVVKAQLARRHPHAVANPRQVALAANEDRADQLAPRRPCRAV